MNRLTVFIFLLFVMSGCAVVPNKAQPDISHNAITIGQSIQAETLLLLKEQRFAELNRTAHLYTRNKIQLPDGQWKVTSFFLAMDDVDDVTNIDEWQERLMLIDRWIGFSPNDPTPHLAKAHLLWRYGWVLRKLDLKGFGDQIKLAVQTLESTKHFTSENPLWFSLRIVLAANQGAEKNSVLALFEEGKNKFPDYDPIYLFTAEYMFHMLGGDQEKLQQFVDEMVKHSSYSQRRVLYTKVYAYLYRQLGERLFKEGYAEWERVTYGFLMLRSRYRDSYVLINSYAYFACRAQDWKTFNKLNEEITRPVLSIWLSRNRYDGCLVRAEKYSRKVEESTGAWTAHVLNLLSR